MKLHSRCTKLSIALAVTAAFGLPAPAQAINLAPNGKGEVLIFPYYTVRNGFDTLISVTNTADRTVLTTLRLREAKNGRPVREFHIALSPHDAWAGAVTIAGTDGALIRTFDATCTAPALGNGPGGSRQIALTPTNYDGSGAPPYDNGGTQLSRVQEGFIEVIEMGISTVPEAVIAATGSSIETASQHVNGVPRDCAVIHNLFADPANFTSLGSGTALPASAFSSFEAPKNVLFGSATLINVASGHAYDATPTTVQNFRSGTPIIYLSQNDKPTLAHGDTSMTATQFDLDGNIVTKANITRSVDAVSMLLMADSLNNEYAIGSTATSSAKTDWVVTFPTKHFYTDEIEAGANAPLPPFSQGFSANGQSCDKFLPRNVDREGKITLIPVVSAGGPTFTWNETCRSANVLSWQASGAAPAGVLASSSEQIVDTSTVGTAGWSALLFPLDDGIIRQGVVTATFRTPLLGFNGLPAIGFAAIERNNGADPGNNRNYGSSRPHVVEVLAP